MHGPKLAGAESACPLLYDFIELIDTAWHLPSSNKLFPIWRPWPGEQIE